MKDDKKALDDDAKLFTVLGEKARSGELQVKDLGPQVGWKTVFLVEYVRLYAYRLCSDLQLCISQAGPLIIHPLIYLYPQVWYGQAVQYSKLQK